MHVRSPALLYYNRALFVADLAEMQRLGVGFEGEDTFVGSESLTADVPGWLVDREGRLVDLVPFATRRERWRPLRWLWNFVRVCYRASPPRPITVGELAERVRGLPDFSEDAPIASDLRDFLATRDPAEVIDAKTLGDWNIGD